jgi:hypothetical protein
MVKTQYKKLNPQNICPSAAINLLPPEKLFRVLGYMAQLGHILFGSNIK